MDDEALHYFDERWKISRQVGIQVREGTRVGHPAKLREIIQVCHGMYPLIL
jgi:hypothetical protein